MGSTLALGSPEEFADDLDLRLGRANGNVYHRSSGLEGIHDGQIMVRLKKKRYVVLDYTIQPTEEDYQRAALNPHIKLPKGAGRVVCKTPDCNKVGVPVCIYDSEPNEPDSLYLRAGLCFQCQRHLNEKRRTERKRPSHGHDVGGKIGDSHPSLIYAIGPSNKKFKYKAGAVVDIESDAVIVNGALEGVRQYGVGYGFPEIGGDLLQLSHEGAIDIERLVHAVSSATTTAAEVVAAVGEPASSDEAAASGVVVDATTMMLDANTSEDINVLYSKAFMTLNSNIFLLTQWKASWDAAISAANQMADPSLADAVASAAAVVAAAADGSDQGSGNNTMVSLLLAADRRKESVDDDEVEDTYIV
jgi:hypothetical protein